MFIFFRRAELKTDFRIGQWGKGSIYMENASHIELSKFYE